MHWIAETLRFMSQNKIYIHFEIKIIPVILIIYEVWIIIKNNEILYLCLKKDNETIWIFCKFLRWIFLSNNITESAEFLSMDLNNFYYYYYV